jgi:hypothetical protein
MSFKKLCGALAAVVIASLLNFSPLSSAQDAPKKADRKSGEKKETAQGTPVLWRDPGDIAARVLSIPPGGEVPVSDLSKLTFVRDDQDGYSVKYRVKDAGGHTWVVKIGNEARPETAAVRIVNALGYVTESNFLVPCVHIPGAPKPRKEVPRCEGDGFADARFEARPEGVKRLDMWSWKQNPFSGTKELKGLAILMAMMNNWDLKDENNQVLSVKGADGSNELRYIVSDTGATFGKTGGGLTHSRNEPEKFAKTKFLKGVEGGKVRFTYGSKSAWLFDDISVGDARWIASLLMRLSDSQLADAFRAANFNEEEVPTLTSAVRARIDELVKATGATPASPAPASMPAAPPATPMTTPTPEPTAPPIPEPTPEPPPSPEPTPVATPTPAATPTPTPPPPVAARTGAGL